MSLLLPSLPSSLPGRPPPSGQPLPPFHPIESSAGRTIPFRAEDGIEGGEVYFLQRGEVVEVEVDVGCQSRTREGEVGRKGRLGQALEVGGAAGAEGYGCRV